VSELDLNAIRRLLHGAFQFLVDDWSIEAGVFRAQGWFLSGYEATENFHFTLNGRPMSQQRLGLPSPALAKVFPYFSTASAAAFHLSAPVSDHDTGSGSLELAICDRLLGEPVVPWQSTFFPLEPVSSAIPAPERLQRTQGNVSLARYLAYGLSTALKVDRILKIYFRERLETVGPILDWGSGCGRVSRHFASRNVETDGCDIDTDNVDWCRENLPGRYVHNDLAPPLPYAANTFGLVTGISVFTHLDETSAYAWRDEVLRVLRPGGVGVFTIHGVTGIARILDDARVQQIAKEGFDASSADGRLDAYIADRKYYRATYQSPRSVRAFFEEKFTFVDQIVGANALLQDFVIVQKP
jgi:SAM-dependent methyltransferase